MIQQLQAILHIDHDWDVAVVGAGGVGSAVARYHGFTDRGFNVKLVFDSDPEKIGMQIDELIVQDYAQMAEIIQQAGIQIAMIAVPSADAQEVADTLVKAGIKAILNYAPISLNVPPGVYVQYIDPSIHLQRMTYYLSR